MDRILLSSSSIFSVSRLNREVRQLLENQWGQIWLSAEISNLSQPTSGHWYFTLKDEHAQVRCAMFRHSNRQVSFRPQNGQQVLVSANITLYEPRGDYQLLIESMQQAGDGVLQQQFEKRKQILAAEGLFDPLNKKPLPDPAQCVGVITSTSGAALHDILHVLKRRDPSLPVIIYPTAVQGNDAPPQIVKAIEIANLRNECDVLIIGRGGGSLEDLWCFNDERVARAIFFSHLPIVSAVGHETDVTIADFVADLRAPTPSAAAELVSRNQFELLRQLQSQRQRIEMAMDYYFAQRRQHFIHFYYRLQQQHPSLRLAKQQTELFKLQHRLEESIQKTLKRFLRDAEQRQQRLIQMQPTQRIHRFQQHIQQQRYHLQKMLEKQLNHYRQRFSLACGRLETVSPLATLARGYSITQTEKGTLIKNTQQTQIGETIITQLQEGCITSEVKNIRVNIK